MRRVARVRTNPGDNVRGNRTPEKAYTVLHASVSIARLQRPGLGTPTVLSFLTFDAYILASVDIGVFNDLGPSQGQSAFKLTWGIRRKD